MMDMIAHADSASQLSTQTNPTATPPSRGRPLGPRLQPAGMALVTETNFAAFNRVVTQFDQCARYCRLESRAPFLGRPAVVEPDVSERFETLEVAETFIANRDVVKLDHLERR